MDGSHESQLPDEGSAHSVGQLSISFRTDETTLCCCESGCGKSFQRPCDLTKHEKTHSRPWKCPQVTCEYHTLGWPSENEMSRHFSDKHSAAPRTYQCLYFPCPYKSKRESNCKLHMEKAHGWHYKRSKKIGKSDQSHQSNLFPETNSCTVPPKIPVSNQPSLPKPDSEDTSSILSLNSPYASIPEARIAPPIGVPTGHVNQTFHTSVIQSQKGLSVQVQPHATELEVLRRFHATQMEGICHLQTYISTLEKQFQARGRGIDEKEQARGDSEQKTHQNAAKRLCTKENRTISSFVPVNDMRRATAVSATANLGDDDSSRKRVKPLPDIILNPDDIIGMKRARNTIAARKSRQRKQQAVEDMENKIEELTRDRDQWKRLAMSRGVTQGSEELG